MPMTGYALRSAIRDILGHFWSESFGQIYPTLAGLTKVGLLWRQEVPRRRASLYEPTPAGRSRLRDLLAEPPQPVPPRNGLLRRPSLARQLGVAGCRALLIEANTDAEARLGMFAGEHSASAALVRANESLALLDSLPQPGGPS